MQWSQIKTLFILCFLLLDIYLLVQFTNKQEKEDVDVLNEQTVTLEDNLKADNITIPDDLSEKEGKYISVEKHVFSEEEISMVKSAEGQETAVIDKGFIISKLTDSIKIPEGATDEEIASLIKSKLELISPESYEYWDWNKEMNVLLFFQEKNNRPIYFNPNGIILVFLNENNEIDFYTQTLLGDIVPNDKQSEQKLAPIQAISVLYQENELSPNTEVTNVDIGYFTRIPLENAAQVFAPTWKVTVDDEINYFVNAIEASIFTSDDTVFLAESRLRIAEKVRQMDSNSELKEYLLNKLTR